MRHVTVKMYAGRADADKARLAEAISVAMADTLDRVKSNPDLLLKAAAPLVTSPEGCTELQRLALDPTLPDETRALLQILASLGERTGGA